MANPQTTINVESIMHEVIRELLANIEKNHGLRVTQIRAEWIDTSTAGGRPSAILSRLSVDSDSL